eukprot:TRINITY_DN5401_c0_g1_i11.p1 TRINITY_DN5401_c0_g1~~TRINITY_DN5401_c0_g1_i11.p1  ORF type:complete len:290 (+),score=88.06 TRINITY_DN5401_c0_g1_i11:60-929(+)
MPVPVSLLAQAGALTSGEVSGDAKGSGGMVVFVGDYPVDVTPDATVADLRKALPDGRRVTLRYQGRELRDSDELADVGVCAEARVDVCRFSPVLTFNDQLPHPRVLLSDDLRTARYCVDGLNEPAKRKPCFVVSNEEVRSGVPFRVRIHAASAQSESAVLSEAARNCYYGVGVSPAVEHDMYNQCRVAEDGGGCGVSINKNGYVYGADAEYLPASVGVSLGSEVLVVHDRAAGKLEMRVFGDHESREPRMVAAADVSRFGDRPLYAAVFFCNAAAAVSFVDPHDHASVE